MHPGHDVELGDQIAEHSPGRHRDSQGSKLKYELDKATAARAGPRALQRRALRRTMASCPDLCPTTTRSMSSCWGRSRVPLCILRARAIGVLTMRDDKGQDDKSSRFTSTTRYATTATSPSSHPPPEELERFFLDYKVLEDKTVNIDAMQGPLAAQGVIRRRRAALPGDDRPR